MLMCMTVWKLAVGFGLIINLKPPCVCWLHRLWVLYDIGVNIIHAIKILSTQSSNCSIESTVRRLALSRQASRYNIP